MRISSFEWMISSMAHVLWNQNVAYALLLRRDNNFCFVCINTLDCECISHQRVGCVRGRCSDVQWVDAPALSCGGKWKRSGSEARAHAAPRRECIRSGAGRRPHTCALLRHVSTPAAPKLISIRRPAARNNTLTGNSIALLCNARAGKGKPQWKFSWQETRTLLFSMQQWTESFWHFGK